VDTEKILYFCTSFTSSLVNAFKQRPNQLDSVLVVKLDEIGDMMYTLHCIEAIAQQHPNAAIDVYCKSMNNDLVKQTGVVRNIFNDENELLKRYDLQIDFRGNWKSLLRALSGKCTMYLDRGSIRLKNKFHGGQKHEIETNQETIQWLFPDDYNWSKPILNVSEPDQAFVSSLLEEQGIHKYVVMHCGARDEARRWPTDRFASVIDHIHEKYSLKTVLVGSPNEQELNAEVCNQTTNAINFAGKTNLLQLGALMRSAKFFVGNESGPLHFAIVEQKPLVALFGPGVKDVFYPLYPNQKVIHHLEDQPTEADKQNSIFKISEQEVIDAVEGLTF